MKPVSFSLVRTAVLSTAMLLPMATFSVAEEFANRGAAAATRYDVTSPQWARTGYSPPYRYANGPYAYAGRGFIDETDYSCHLSPGSQSHIPCNHY